MALVEFPWQTILQRLRSRIIVTLLVFTALSTAGWWVTPYFVTWILDDQSQLSGLVILAPTEGLLSRLKLAVAVGASAAFPFLLWQIRAVFLPVMGRSERRTTLWIVPVSGLLFFGGLVLAIVGIVPIALRFLLQFAGEELEPLIRAQSLVDFLIGFAIPFGLVFQLPVVTWMLARAGILQAAALRQARRYAIVGIFVVAAILTPADPFSQTLMALPLVILYELGIVLAAVAGRARSRAGVGV